MHVSLDLVSSRLTVTVGTGAPVQMQFPADWFPDPSAIAQAAWSHNGPELQVVTTTGHELAFELPPATSTTTAENRITVYLDQNQWSRLARCLRQPSTVNVADREVAERIAELVRTRQIVLPASAGHYVETTAWGNLPRRQDLALTILELSRGWQMRHTLDVRHQELYQACRGNEPRAVDPVFTLQPDAIFGPGRSSPDLPAPDEPPDADVLGVSSIRSALAHVDTILDPGPVERQPATDWVELNQGFSDWLATEKLDTQQRRSRIDLLLLVDFKGEIARAAHEASLSVAAMSQWIQEAASAAIAVMPASGLFREMLFEKHSNAKSTWRTSDLTDMTHLSCAAGYADVVVCEGYWSAALDQGQNRLGRRPNTFRTLESALVEIERLVSRPA